MYLLFSLATQISNQQTQPLLFFPSRKPNHFPTLSILFNVSLFRSLSHPFSCFPFIPCHFATHICNKVSKQWTFNSTLWWDFSNFSEPSQMGHNPFSFFFVFFFFFHFWKQFFELDHRRSFFSCLCLQCLVVMTLFYSVRFYCWFFFLGNILLYKEPFSS